MPPEINQCTKLEELNLSVNKLKELPRGYGCLNKISFLDLSSNELKEIGPQIGMILTLKVRTPALNSLLPTLREGRARSLWLAWFKGVLLLVQSAQGHPL